MGRDTATRERFAAPGRRRAGRACAPRPLWVTLRSGWTEHIGQEHKFPRPPTPEEMRIMAFYAIAAGAKGINYFMYPTERPRGGRTILHGLAEYPQLCEAVRDINEDLEVLAPLIPISHPADFVRPLTEKVRARALVCGEEAMLVILVNQNYRSLRDGFECQPAGDVRVEVPALKWLPVVECGALESEGFKRLRIERRVQRLLLHIGDVETVKTVLLSARQGLAQELVATAEAKRKERTRRLREIREARERHRREQEALRGKILREFKSYAVRSRPIRAYGIARKQLWNPRGEKYNAWEWYDEKGGKRYGVVWTVNIPAERVGVKHTFYVNFRIVGIRATLRVVNSKGRAIAERKIEPSSAYRIFSWDITFPASGEYRIELTQDGKGYEHGKVAKQAFLVPASDTTAAREDDQ